MTRVNVGCGMFPLPGWTNLDADSSTPAEIHAHVPPLPFEDASVDEVYLGHVLEHLEPADAHALLLECHRALVPGGRIGVVVPDTREIVRRYLGGIGTVEGPDARPHPAGDLDVICAMFLYSTVQPSRHLWSYDMETLGRALARAGFGNLAAINRHADPRITKHEWYGCGWDGFKVSA